MREEHDRNDTTREEALASVRAEIDEIGAALVRDDLATDLLETGAHRVREGPEIVSGFTHIEKGASGG